MQSVVLIAASTASHIDNFHMPYIDWIIENHCVVDILCSGQPRCNYTQNYNIKFSKAGNIFSLVNSIKSVAALLKKNNYKLISVHTTLAAGVCRLALILSGNKKTKLVYVCHGYLFSMDKGVKKFLQILCEKILSLSTHCLVTMNEEDYNYAVKYKLCSRIHKINGMGIDEMNYPISSSHSNHEALFKGQYSLPQNRFLCSCIGEVNNRKNQMFILRCIPLIIKYTKDIHFVFAGEGRSMDACNEFIKRHNLEDYVTMLGYCNEIPMLLQASDIIVSASRCEGNPFNIMEGLLYGKSILASDIKGHRDLLKDMKSCKLFSSESQDSFLDAFLSIKNNANPQPTTLDSKYYLSECFGEMTKIYESFLNAQ